MARYCSDCTYLNPDKAKDGAKGCYKCSKKGKFMLANTPACDKFDKAYARSNYKKEELYDQGKELSNRYTSKTSPGTLLVLLIILVIIAILVNAN